MGSSHYILFISLVSCLLQLANKLNNACKAQQRAPLDVYVQVNTSGEESKYGVEPQDCVSIAEHVHKECDLLKFAGLMTIGQKDYSSRPEDFQVGLPSHTFSVYGSSLRDHCLSVMPVR